MSYNSLRFASRVKRFHTIPTTRDQSLAEHSYGVAVILLHIYEGNVRPELLKAALYHDLAELETGDIPATTKWRSPELRRQLSLQEAEFDKRYNLTQNLTAEETRELKFADMMELCQFCIDEINMGNKNAIEPLRNGVQFFDSFELSELPAKAKILLDSVVSSLRSVESTYDK
jgi:5'-deoxynucleotidase YfbR-like HD superfamily hydrolase